MKRKPPPDGWDTIEPTIEMYEQKMKEAVEVQALALPSSTMNGAGFGLRRGPKPLGSRMQEPHEGMRKAMSTWMITKLHFEKNRFIFEAFYKVRRCDLR